MRRSLFTIVLPIVLWSGCVRLNAEHCGNQDGDLTCMERGGATVYCNVCVSQNDGCRDEAPSAACAFGPPSGTSTTDASTATTTTAPQTGVTSNDMETSADASSSEGGVSGCGDGVVDVAAGEQCDGGVAESTCTSLGFGNGDLECQDNCIFDIRDCTDPPMCGNGVQEDGEACDTQETRSCSEEDPASYGGGQIVCAGCSWNEDGCEACITMEIGQPECDPEDDRCCEGTACDCGLIGALLQCRCS